MGGNSYRPYTGLESGNGRTERNFMDGSNFGSNQLEGVSNLSLEGGESKKLSGQILSHKLETPSKGSIYGPNSGPGSSNKLNNDLFIDHVSSKPQI